MKTLILLLLILSVACVQQDEIKSANQNNQTATTSCDLSSVDENLTDPETIDELVNLINALPKPLTADCFMKSLKRPLYVNASSSTLSAQPADGWSSPRIFIFKGNLIIALVPTGVGSKLLEFSEMINSQRSIKGEIALPVLSNISHTDPFARINYPNRTSCSGCHTSELLESTINGVPVYSSIAFRPRPSDDVYLDYLKDAHYLCQAQMSTSSSCNFWSGLFSHGDVIAKPFPTTMVLPSNTFGL